MSVGVSLSVGASLSRELLVISIKSSRDKLAPTVQGFKCFRISKVSPPYFRPVSLHDGLWSVHCHPARICVQPIPHLPDAATCPINPNELVFCRSELVCRSELASRAFCHCDEKLARQARSYSSTVQRFNGSTVSTLYFRPVSLHDGLWSVHCHPARICAPPIPHPLDAATCPGFHGSGPQPQSRSAPLPPDTRRSASSCGTC